MPTNPAAVNPLDLLGRVQNKMTCHDFWNVSLTQYSDAIAAIRELLAADREYDLIISRYGYGPEINASTKRRAAALARFES